MKKRYKRSTRKPYQIKLKKSILRNRFFWIFFFLIIITGTGIYFALFSPYFQVYQLSITGNRKIKSVDIQSVINSQLRKQLLFWQSQSIFILNQNQTEELILNKFPLIDNIKISKKLPDILIITVREKEAVGIYCGKNNLCFSIDKKGVIFEYGLLNDNLFTARSEIESGEISLGKQAVEEEFVSSLVSIFNKLKSNLNITPAEMIIINQERINVKMSENWEIYFNPSKDLDWQLTELDLVLKQEIPAEKRPMLEYIDLRFSKVYYKYR